MDASSAAAEVVDERLVAESIQKLEQWCEWRASNDRVLRLVFPNAIHVRTLLSAVTARSSLLQEAREALEEFYERNAPRDIKGVVPAVKYAAMTREEIDERFDFYERHQVHRIAKVLVHLSVFPASPKQLSEPLGEPVATQELSDEEYRAFLEGPGGWPKSEQGR